MRDTDLPAIADIAAVVHPSLPEDTGVFAERLKLYPDGCYVFERRHVIEGYIISHPWIEEPPALNTMLGELPAAPDTYYFHDLALLPSARSSGAGAAIVTALIEHARQCGFSRVSLVAVNGSESFWRKHGFRLVQDQNITAKIQCYGSGARAMRATLSPT